jgi:ATP-binding protein involved in chromosome partitioning
MFEQMGVPVLGVVENMSWFSPPDQPLNRYPIFGSGGGQTLADATGVPLLAQIPIELPVQEGGDQGSPVSLSQPQNAAGAAFIELAKRLQNLLQP